ncbi:sodium:proton exchanger [Glacieibacterium frigidum]|uniref:Sodium:proton exchanger n=1 Tax=Glacieibacterium frigidum TaxID=2593303 RepID=A0A552UJD1_9SPHN|nr:sodium:proton exchanger [Glacieibacterium frigidum]
MRDTVAYFAAVVVIVPLFSRFGLGAVLGYLAAGIVIGPSLLGLVQDPESASGLAEFGIVLLLFVIGLELKPSRLWSLRRDIFGLGASQVVVCGLALTAVLMALTSLSWQAALVVGLPLGLSSTALVMQLLAEKDITNTPFGTRSFSMLLFQDLAIVPLLTIVAALSRVPPPPGLPPALDGLQTQALRIIEFTPLTIVPGWLQGLVTVVALGLLVLIGRYGLNPAFRLIGQLRVREAFAAAALLTVLGAALLMQSLGLSMALGAFVAGVMLAESPYRHALEADIEPFRGLLLGLFFVSVGMTLDLNVVRDQFGLIVLLVIAVLATKTIVIGLLARAFGTGWLRAFQMGLLLAQGGEFGFVLFAAAQQGALISGTAAQLFGAVVTLSMVLTPLLVRLASRFNPAEVARTDLDGPEAAAPQDAAARVLLVGGGRFGQGVAQMLLARGVEVIAIDNDPELIDVSRLFGNRVYFGDGRRVDILRAAGAENAQAVVLAIDGKWDVGIIQPIRDAFPDLKIVARTYDRIHLLDLLRLHPEVTAVREVFDSGVAAGRATLEELGTPPETIAAIEAEFRRRDGERLELQLCSGDQLSGAERLFRPGVAFIPEAMGEIPFAGPIDADDGAPSPQADLLVLQGEPVRA